MRDSAVCTGSVNDFSDPQAQNFQAAWEKLRKRYHHLNATLAIQCHRSLNNFTWHDGNNLTTYFERFNQLLFDCARANLTIDNAQQYNALLCGLPEHFSTNITNPGDMDNPNKLKIHLCQLDLMQTALCKSSTRVNSDNHILYHQSGQKRKAEHQQQRSTSSSSTMLCDYCKKRNHIKVDCMM